tara:strand:- start:39 stop:683 length:645 start_codon:yes stop_codon:yes gene_type:complete
MKDIAKYIDHTSLLPNITEKDIQKLCDEAMQYNFASVCINPIYVPLAVKYLKNSFSKVCTVIGFPFGAISSEMKFAEAMLAIHQGAEELDMVINIGALKEGENNKLEDEITKVVKSSEDVCLKVIIETCLLTKEEKIRISKIARDSGADFVKTSTGFSERGAVVEDIKIIRKTVGETIGVKASGGIKFLSDVNKMLNAGANRIGTSSGVSILNE